MKTQSKDIQLAVKTLLKVRGELKELRLQEDDLVSKIKAYMGTEALLETSEGVALIEMRQTTSFDKEKLIYDFGAEVIRKYQKVTEYQAFILRPLKQVRVGS